MPRELLLVHLDDLTIERTEDAAQIGIHRAGHGYGIITREKGAIAFQRIFDETGAYGVDPGRRQRVGNGKA